jgi:hypothetical protein
MMVGLMLFFDCILVDGRSLFVGLVKTDLSWFNNKSAFPLLSLMRFVPFFSGVKPLDS